LLGHLVDEGPQALECHVLHLAIRVAQREEQSFDRLRAGGLLMLEEARVASAEDVLQVAEGHEPKVGVLIV